MHQFDQLNLHLLKKYSTPGPRYTSYPTAPLFSANFGPKEYLGEIEKTNQPDASTPLSLYFHLPYCDTLCYFCGCTMKVTHNRNKIRDYNDLLKKEIALIAPLISKKRKVVQLHWGGGTPSYLNPSEIYNLGNFIRDHFNFDPDLEAGVEIDPRGLTYEHMKAFREVGFNRISMGVQDFDTKVQESVNRVQSEKITRDAVNWSRQLGFQSINLDLIYGLPFQTPGTFSETVDKIIDISPERIAVFNYAHVPWMKKHQRIMDEKTLPSAEVKLEIFKLTIEKLLNAGYWNIGMDHFAKTSDELHTAQQNGTLYRNFQGYSTRAGCDLYGFGMSAIGHFTDTYHQNYKDIGTYGREIEQGIPATHVGYRMTRDDHIRKEVIMKIMCDMELRKKDIEDKYSLHFDTYFAGSIEKLKPLAEDGLVKVFNDKVTVVGIGRLVVRNIAMCFDAYIDHLVKDKPVFSKTV